MIHAYCVYGGAAGYCPQVQSAIDLLHQVQFYLYIKLDTQSSKDCKTKKQDSENYSPKDQLSKFMLEFFVCFWFWHYRLRIQSAARSYSVLTQAGCGNKFQPITIPTAIQKRISNILYLLILLLECYILLIEFQQDCVIYHLDIC